MTDWEIGNEIGSNLTDGILEKYNEVKDTHPELADVLWQMGHILGVAANNLMGDQACGFRESENIRVDALRMTAVLQDKKWWCRKKGQ